LIDDQAAEAKPVRDADDFGPGLNRSVRG
jgi:hypothetical protein